MSEDNEGPNDHRAVEPYGGESPRILAMLKSRARRGDLRAARELAQVYEARRSSFQIVHIKTLDQIATAHEKVLEAAINGSLTPREAESISRLLMAHGEALRGKVLERKLAFAEKQVHEESKRARF